VFLDETGANTRMTRLYGRSLKGRRCLAKAPGGHWQTTTFIGALRSQGLVAPLVLDGPMTGPAFRAWVEQALVPVLQPNDIVIMDNLRVHKVADVVSTIEAAGATVRYLPPYSPDYNPIEQVFAKLKSLLRKEAARTRESLWSAVGNLLNRFTPMECERYIRHAGYANSG